MTAYSKTQINNSLNQNIKSNGQSLITGSILNQQLKDINESTANLVDKNTFQDEQTFSSPPIFLGLTDSLLKTTALGTLTVAIADTDYLAPNGSASGLTGLTSGQVTTALNYTPANKAGDTFTGAINVKQILTTYAPIYPQNLLSSTGNALNLKNWRDAIDIGGSFFRDSLTDDNVNVQSRFSFRRDGAFIAENIAASLPAIGVGTGTPLQAAGWGAVTVNGSAGSGYSMQINSVETARLSSNTAAAIFMNYQNTPMIFGVNGIETARLSSNIMQLGEANVAGVPNSGYSMNATTGTYTQLISKINGKNAWSYIANHLGASFLRSDVNGNYVDTPFFINSSDGVTNVKTPLAAANANEAVNASWVRSYVSAGSAGLVSIANGGTGATTVAGALSNFNINTLGLIGRNTLQPVGSDLNTLLIAGACEVSNPVNAPHLGMTYVYVDIKVHYYSPNYALQTLTDLSAGLTRSVSWQRQRIAGVWQRWVPVSGFVTPAHFGGFGTNNPQDATSDSSLALNRWLNSDLPLFLDQNYMAASSISVDLNSLNGYMISGRGARSGIVLTNSASVSMTNAFLDNPNGFRAGAITLSDLNIYVSGYSSSVPLIVGAQDGATGSGLPGIELRNINIIPVDNNSGSSDALIRLVNIRNGVISNVGGSGKYFGYQGAGIDYVGGGNSASVEVYHYGCRMYHVGTGYRRNASLGNNLYDDSQGHGWANCTAIAVDRGWDLQGGPEGFGEWFTINGCHAYFRELGVFGNNAGNNRIENNYFLAHGAANTAQGVALQGTSIENFTTIDNNRIRFDACTAPNRYGLNVSGGLYGHANGNRVTAATNAYGLLSTSILQLQNT